MDLVEHRFVSWLWYDVYNLIFHIFYYFRDQLHDVSNILNPIEKYQRIEETFCETYKRLSLIIKSYVLIRSEERWHKNVCKRQNTACYLKQRLIIKEILMTTKRVFYEIFQYCSSFSHETHRESAVFLRLSNNIVYRA